MKKYMIRFESSSGSLAVEKSMHTYIRVNYADCIVTESAIESIVTDLNEQVNKYRESHRGKAVEVFCHKNGVTDGYFISVGSLTMCLVAIKRELGEYDYEHGYYKAVNDCCNVMKDFGVFEWLSSNTVLNESLTELAFRDTMVEKFRSDEGIGLQAYIDKVYGIENTEMLCKAMEGSI